MEFLTVDDIAKRLKVHPVTVKRWLRDGKLGGILLGNRAGWRISEEDLAKFLDEQRKATQGGKAAA